MESLRTYTLYLLGNLARRRQMDPNTPDILQHILQGTEAMYGTYIGD